MNEKNKIKPIVLRSISAIIIVCFVFFVMLFSFSSLCKTLYPLKFTNCVEIFCKEYNLSQYFVFAVIKCESNFKIDAVSKTGARGLMQLMPDTFDWISSKLFEESSFEKAFEAETNIEYGCYLYSYLLKRYNNKHTAIAAYHAGIGSVDKWLRDERYSKDGKTLYEIPFPSTKKYVNKVIETEKIYNKLYG